MCRTVLTRLEEGWQKPHIQPFGNLSTHPGCSSLHYAAQVCPCHLEFHLCALTHHMSIQTLKQERDIVMTNAARVT